MLITEPNLTPADDFYETLLAAHENLSLEQSVAFNARLILVLANHIGDMTVLSEALDVASETAKSAE
ncbi:MAG: DUF2783 domain-containing protein [Rhizobiaceae bacterium]|nr:DUF2783 domain-containing protein [Rhizobiaceae bacterium]